VAQPLLDEEALAETRPAESRRRTGAYYTPRALVDCALDAVGPLPTGQVRVIDPACGAGAFLAAAAERYPGAELLGVEISKHAAAQCRERVPRARVMVGDALRGALPPSLDETFELWVGNPPYNGTSPLLRNAAAYERMRALIPPSMQLPRGTSLRDDFAFFLLLARSRLVTRPGALVFVTPTTLLDSFLYAPLRQTLLDSSAKHR
jgi:type I restriction-modification system DNA methylase subunit